MVIQGGSKKLANREITPAVRLGTMDHARRLRLVVKRGLESSKISGSPSSKDNSELGFDAPRGHEVIAKQLKEALFMGGSMSIKSLEHDYQEVVARASLNYCSLIHEDFNLEYVGGR